MSRVGLFTAALLFVLPLAAQRGTGELRVSVTDASGSALESKGRLTCRAVQFDSEFRTGADGRWLAKGLPFGVYQIQTERAGFATFSGLIEVRSEVPVEYRVTLGVAPIETKIDVTGAGTLLDPNRTGSPYYLGTDTLRERQSSQPGRGVLELVQTQPGWLLEANGVLHPRGSEYETQYVIDGIPITDNRSPAFASAFDLEDVESMNVMTANYPAEFGRKLGGVVEVRTIRDTRPGLHWKAVTSGGSFDTVSGYLGAQYQAGRTTAAASFDAAHTARYLDPPVMQNFTNSASSSGGVTRLERDFSDSDRVRIVFTRRRTGFLVPNETSQELAGQRQDRANHESLGQFAFQHVFNPRLLLSVCAMSRDLTAELWSNPRATPISAAQDRGFRETYVAASVSRDWAGHALKAGVEASFASIRETFSYRIIDRSFFDRDTARRFSFDDRRQNREQAAYIQDQFRAGRWSFTAGLRWDHYRLFRDDNAISPRLGAAWHWPTAGVVFHASYDRAFQTPAIENLLLASSAAAQRLNDAAFRLPVPPSRGNFYQAGFTKSLFGKMRLDANVFRRDVRDFADDSLLLNTGISFPIAFAHARVHGVEVRLEIPQWGRWSGFLSYSNLTGVGRLPITGGLFLDDAAAQLLRSNASFPITQDQRNTVHGRVRFQAHPRVWLALPMLYGSGLPIETDELVSRAALERQYGAAILRRVNLERGRVRPSFSLDASAGAELWKSEQRRLRAQIDATNLTNRLNVINFAGIFSGTAIASPRAVAAKLAFDF